MSHPIPKTDEHREVVEPKPRLVTLTLPPKVPTQRLRPTQSNIPNDRAERDRLKQITIAHLKDEGVVPPLSMQELLEHSTLVVEKAEVDPVYRDFIAVLVNNEAWRETIARIPFSRRLLLIPKCLRVEEHCPAPFDEFGLLCKECGLCSIQDLSVEAERLGYAVLVAEGSAIVRQLIETGKIDGIVGVSCLNVLEKCFPHMEAAAIPGVSIPLLQDDCVNTNVDLDWVWDLIHLTSEDRSYRLDLDALKKKVRSWFEMDSLQEVLGDVRDETDLIARQWLARDGKRWRPYLAVCAAVAVAEKDCHEEPQVSETLRTLAVAVECFHKASLIHDDIEDADQKRYGEASLHVEHGMPVALNVGDYLIGEGFRLICELDLAPATKNAMLQAASRGMVTLCRGQGAELIWAASPRPLSSLEVLDIFRHKTAPAFETALKLGALFSEADPAALEALSDYSEALGIAYQIRDDLEDYSGESDSHDLRDFRLSLILAIALKRSGQSKDKKILKALWEGSVSYSDVEDDVKRILEQGEIPAKARELLEAYKEQAVRSLRYLQNPTLKGLLRRVIGKIFGEQLIEGYCSEFEARNAPGGALGAPNAGKSHPAGN